MRDGFHPTHGDGSYAALGDGDTIDPSDQASPTPRGPQEPAQRATDRTAAQRCSCGGVATRTAYVDLKERSGKRGHPSIIDRAARPCCDTHAADIFAQLLADLGGHR